MDIKKKFGPLANIEFNKLFLSEILSHFADGTIQFVIIAMLIAILPKIGSVMAILLFTFMLPQFLLSPFAGALSDRFSRKLILSASSFFRFFVLLTLIFLLAKVTISPIMAYIFTFLLGTGAALFYTSKMSILPNVVKSSELKFANAINSSIGSIALLFGAFLSNVFVTNFGSKYSLFVIAGMYLLSGLIILTLKLNSSQQFLKNKNNILKEIQFSINYIRTHKKALSLVILSICTSFIVAVFSNTLNSLITDYYGLGFSDLTNLRTMLAISIVFGMGITIYLSRIMRVVHLFACGFTLLCLALLTSPLCPSVAHAWFWFLPIGVADAIVVVMVDTILQKVTPDRLRGKIFGFQLTLTTMSFLAGTLIVANVTDLINPLVIFKFISIITLVITLIILLTDKNFRYLLVKATIGHIFLFCFKYNFEGVDNLPKKGKVILAGNHTGHLDPFIIQMATNRQIWFVTDHKAFKIPIIKHFLKYLSAFSLRFEIESLEAAIPKLKAGEAVVIFPEGDFTPDGNLCKFHRGVGIMAKEANCPIVPFAIQGGYETWGKGRTLPKLFNHITIQFGQPISSEDYETDREIAQELRVRVNFLKNALYRRALYDINQKLYSNFLDLLQEKGDVYGQIKALSIKTKDSYESFSYIDLSIMAKKFANHLIETVGIQRNDRIAILTESRPEFGIGIFAAIQTGAITVPLDCKLTVPEWTSILSDCNPKVLCCSSHYVEQATEIKNNVPSIEHIFILDKEKPENCEYLTTFEVKADIDKDMGRPRSLDETALLVYTSGTTGNPKGVMISFANIYSQVRDFEKIMKFDSDDTLISILPLNHLLELNVGFMGMLYMGAKVCYVKSLSPKEISKVMKEKEATNMIVVPLFVKMLKNSIEKEIHKQPKMAQSIFNFMYKLAKYMPLSIKRRMFKSIIDGFGGKMECFVCGGAPLENDVAEFFDRIGIPAYQGYGLTETSPVVSFNCPSKNKNGSVGQALPSVDVKIADNGEVLVSGPNVMQGYYGKPDMTKEVIDENGWFHTGDIGEIDKDGYIYITGRIKNMIVLGGGKKIFPEEVEAVLEQSDLIKELCVLSLKIKSGNKSGTEEVGAIIVPSDDLAKKTDKEIQEELEREVKELSSKNLAPYKMPTVIVVRREELPKTSTRKVRRNELLNWYENSSN